MNNVTTFRATRLKLTIWYLIIIMLISILFSGAIYIGINSQLSRISQIQPQEGKSFETAFRNFLNDQQEKGYRIPRFNDIPTFNPIIVSEIRTRLITTLVVVNFAILGIAGYAGYFLAGRTLQPIKEMIDEQNRFITDASHELKTPLTALRTEFEVAMLDKEKLGPNESHQLITSSFEEIVHLQGLAENLIELTQQQKKRANLQMEDVSLLEIIEGALKKTVPLAKQKHIIIHNEVDDYLLLGDHKSLTELFVILLDNAIKYSLDTSEITLLSKKTDHHVQITVSDTGIGISKDDLEHIFDRFYRADKSRSKTLGYGLGLSIANEIIVSHKGTIHVESELNKSTTFTLVLPFKK